MPRKGIILALGSAALWALASARFQDWSAILLNGLFGAIFPALALTDLEQSLIPNRIVYPAMALAAALSWLWPNRGVDSLFLGGGLALAATLAVYLPSRGGFGAGDVKMAALVVGYPAVVIAGFAAAVSAGVVAALLVAKRSGGQRRYMPYGPFIALGGLVALFW